MMIQQASSWHSPIPKPIKALTGALALLSGVRPTAARLGGSFHQDMAQAPGAEHFDATPGYCQLPHSSDPIQEKKACAKLQKSMSQHQAASRANQTTQTTAIS